MPAHRTPRWTAAEVAVLHEHYPAEGIEVAARLPARTWHAIHVKAHKLALSTTRLGDAPQERSGPSPLTPAHPEEPRSGVSKGLTPAQLAAVTALFLLTAIGAAALALAFRLINRRRARNG